MKSKEEKVFYQFQTGIKKGIVFIKISDQFVSRVDPGLIFKAVMEDVHLQNKIVSKNCHRLIPIQKAVKNELEQIREAVQSLVEQKVEQSRQVHWMCQFKSRFQEKIKKQEVYDLCGLIMAEHQVNFKEPEYTIYVEVNKTNVYLSVIEKYLEYKKCALHNYQHLQQPKLQDQPQKKLKQESLHE